MYSLNISTKGNTMALSTTPFWVQSILRFGDEVRLNMVGMLVQPDSLEAGMTVYLTTTKPACPRTSDMQDLVDRCEAKVKPPEKGWRKVMRNDICHVIDENDNTVAMIPATWWLIAQTDEERAAELRQRREAYFTNCPLLVNAKRMFDLLEEIADAPYATQDGQSNARNLITQIKTQQWRLEQPTQG
jgi:hypothetical protein